LILELRVYDAAGYQDDGASAPVTFLEVTVVSDETRLTVGRLFWTDGDAVSKIIGDGDVRDTPLYVKDERKVRT
jgi:hypothetical protein